jgi:hypothetical protein
VIIDAFQYSYNLGTFFFAMAWMTMLEEEDAEAASLSAPVAALELEAAASPVTREV